MAAHASALLSMLLGVLRPGVGRTPHVAVTLTGRVLAAAALQMTFEFGPPWLLAASAAGALFGPYPALMTATLGPGGRLAVLLVLGLGNPPSRRRGHRADRRRAHPDAGRSHLGGRPRPSGASTLSWLTFLPASALFGLLGAEAGIRSSRSPGCSSP